MWRGRPEPTGGRFLPGQILLFRKKKKKALGNIIYSETLFVPKAETEQTANEIEFASSIPDVFGMV